MTSATVMKGPCVTTLMYYGNRKTHKRLGLLNRSLFIRQLNMCGKRLVRTEEIVWLEPSFVSCSPHQLADLFSLINIPVEVLGKLSPPLHHRQGISPGRKMSYVVFTASVLTLMAVAAATDRNKPFKAHLDLSNTPSAVGLLFESQAASIARCAVLCSSDACCSRFNFAKSGSTPGVCRAYRTGMTSGSSGTSAVRSGTFILQGKEVSGKIRHLCPTCCIIKFSIL